MLTPNLPSRAAAARPTEIRPGVLVPRLPVYSYAARRQLGPVTINTWRSKGCSLWWPSPCRQLRTGFPAAESCRNSHHNDSNPGDKVTILDQGFAGIESIFMTMDGEERVILLINLMNRQQQISLPLASISNR